MNKSMRLPLIYGVIPIVAMVIWLLKPAEPTDGYFLLMGAALIGAVLCGVHHAEVIAHKVGEPMGTLILAVAITIIEVGLIITISAKGGPQSAVLARDTVLSAVMIIITGIMGICLLVGAWKHSEQLFNANAVSTSLVTLLAICVLTMILPNFTESTAGPSYNRAQLILISILCLIIYATYVVVQTVRHRDYFQPNKEGAEHAEPPSAKIAWLSLLFLIISLISVVFLAKATSPAIENILAYFGAPPSVIGVVIALVILLPEGLAAIKNASHNRLQTSLNLGLGSAIASIGLTIPTVAFYSIITDSELILGINPKASLLLIISFLLLTLSLRTDRTTIMQGVVLLTFFIVYLFMSFVP